MILVSATCQILLATCVKQQNYNNFTKMFLSICHDKYPFLSLVSTCTLKGAWDMSKVPVTHIFYCAWLKTQVETCVTGTLDMSQAPLRHKWKPGFRLGHIV